MSSTGNVFPGTGESVDRSALTAWTNPGNIVSDNATDATCNATGSDYLVARNFGFTIPAGATISGVLVRVEASEHSTGTEPLLAQLQDDAAALVGSSKSTSNEGSISGTTKSVYTYGSTSDVWGATLTSTIVNDPDFGVRLWFTTAHDIRIDYVTVAIEYVAGAIAGTSDGTSTVSGSLVGSGALVGSSAGVTTVGSPLLTPDEGLTAWYDASRSGSLWQDDERTTAADDNDERVASFDDLSGYGRHVLPATDGNRATLKTSIQTGKSVVRFNGSDQYLDTTSWENDYPSYVVAVLIPRHATNAGVPFARADVGNRNAIVADVGDGWRQISVNAGTHRGTCSDGVCAMVGSAYDTGTACFVRVNGTEYATEDLSTDQGGAGLRLGNNGASEVAYYAGDICELRVYSPIPDSTKRAAIWTDLDTKWGISPGPIVGSTAGTSTASGTLLGNGALVGSSDGVATTGATARGDVSAEGSAAGAATVSGTLEGLFLIAGTSDGLATTTATLSGAGALAGSSAGAATTTATAQGDVAAAGSAAGAATVTGAMTGLAPIVGTSDGSATATATASGSGALVGSAAGAATVTGDLTELGAGAIFGSTSGLATTSGTLVGSGALVGSSSGAATVSGLLSTPETFIQMARLVGSSAVSTLIGLNAEGRLVGSNASVVLIGGGGGEVRIQG